MIEEMDFYNRGIVVNGVSISETVYAELGHDLLFAGLSAVDTYILARAAENDREWNSSADWETGVAPFTAYSLNEEDIACVLALDPTENVRHVLVRTSGKHADKVELIRFESRESLLAEVKRLDDRIDELRGA